MYSLKIPVSSTEFGILRFNNETLEYIRNFLNQSASTLNKEMLMVFQSLTIESAPKVARPIGIQLFTILIAKMLAHLTHQVIETAFLKHSTDNPVLFTINSKHTIYCYVEACVFQAHQKLDNDFYYFLRMRPSSIPDEQFDLDTKLVEISTLFQMAVESHQAFEKGRDPDELSHSICDYQSMLDKSYVTMKHYCESASVRDFRKIKWLHYFASEANSRLIALQVNFQFHKRLSREDFNQAVLRVSADYTPFSGRPITTPCTHTK